MRLSSEELHYNRRRWRRDDGSEYVTAEAVSCRVDLVEFHDRIAENVKAKLADIADLRLLKAKARGVETPVVLVWEGYDHQEPVRPLQELSLDAGIVYASRNAWVTHHLRQMVRDRNFSFKDGRLQIKDSSTQAGLAAENVLDELYQENRLVLYGVDATTTTADIRAKLDPERDIIAVGQLGFPSQYARGNFYPLVCNGAYFLFEEEDFASDFSLMGDSYSLVMANGKISTPPVYRRSTLFLDYQGGADLRIVGLTDLIVHCLGKDWDLRRFAYNQPSTYTVYNRHYGVRTEGRTMGHTPASPGSVDIILMAQAVVGFKAGGDTPIPQNGFVLSVPTTEVDLQGKDTKVTYTLPWDHSYRTAMQCGPGLIKDGEIILGKGSLVAEEFFRKGTDQGQGEEQGVVPTDYAEDIDQTRAARTVVGIDADGNFRVLAVEAVNLGMAEAAEGESSGASLQELAELLQYHGYQYALNLDGGGSTNIQYHYGHLLRGADRRGLSGVFYERMVPSVGVIRLQK